MTRGGGEEGSGHVHLEESQKGGGVEKENVAQDAICLGEIRDGACLIHERTLHACPHISTCSTSHGCVMYGFDASLAGLRKLTV